MDNVCLFMDNIQYHQPVAVRNHKLKDLSLLLQVFGTRLDTDIPKEASVAGEQESLIGSLGLCHACCCRSWGRRRWWVSKLQKINLFET